MSFINFFLWQISFDFCFCYYLLRRRANKHFDVHFRRIRPVLFCRKMQNTRSMKEKMEGKVFHYLQSPHFSFIRDMIKSTFPYLYFDLSCNHLCFPPKKNYKQEKRKYSIIIYTVTFPVFWYHFPIISTLCWYQNLFPHKRRDKQVVKKIEISSVSTTDKLFLTGRAMLRNKRTLAAVSRENPKTTKNTQSQKSTNPGIAEQYITQVSEESENLRKKLYELVK